MEYFKAQDSRYRISFNSFTSNKMKEQVPTTPLKTFSVMDNFNLYTGREQHHLFSTSKVNQPPPFIIGGYVGSKSCEQKAVSFNCGDLLGQIIKIATSFEPAVNPPKMFPERSKSTELPGPVPPRNAESSAKTNVTNIPPIPRSPAEPPKTVMPSNLKEPSPKPVGSGSAGSDSEHSDSDSSEISESESDEEVCELQSDITKTMPSVSRARSVSESSDGSWTSDDDSPPERPQTCSNPWLRNIVVCPSDDDGDDDDDDSDWDCVSDDDDFASENGEIISEFKWNHYDSLSPITSPVTRTPPASTPALEDYNSDESEGVLIVCGYGYESDDEDDVREKELAKKRMEDLYKRWLEKLEQPVDVPDGKEKTSAKKVRFPVDEKLVKVHSMVAWSYAYRAARKGDWDNYARDSARFRERIQTIEPILAPVLQPSHRERIRLRNQTLEIPANSA